MSTFMLLALLCAFLFGMTAAHGFATSQCGRTTVLWRAKAEERPPSSLSD